MLTVALMLLAAAPPDAVLITVESGGCFHEERASHWFRRRDASFAAESGATLDAADVERAYAAAIASEDEASDPRDALADVGITRETITERFQLPRAGMPTADEMLDHAVQTYAARSVSTEWVHVTLRFDDDVVLESSQLRTGYVPWTVTHGDHRYTTWSAKLAHAVAPLLAGFPRARSAEVIERLNVDSFWKHWPKPPQTIYVRPGSTIDDVRALVGAPPDLDPPYEDAEALVDKHRWLRAWKDADRGRRVMLVVGGVVATRAWRDAGLPGEPDADLALQDGALLGEVLFSKDDHRALVVSKDKRAPPLHWLDELAVDAHHVIVVSPDGSHAVLAR